YWEVKKIFPPEKVEKFLDVVRNYILKYNLDPYDDRVSFSVRPRVKLLAFIIGNRYALAIEKKRKGIVFSFISPEILSEKHGHFNNHKKEIEAYWNRVEKLEGFEVAIEKGFNI